MNINYVHCDFLLIAPISNHVANLNQNLKLSGKTLFTTIVDWENVFSTCIFMYWKKNFFRKPSQINALEGVRVKYNKRLNCCIGNVKCFLISKIFLIVNENPFDFFTKIYNKI